jgi:histidine triad (HIT) family protein
MCLFCKIISKEIPAKFLYEDDEVVAIADVRPVAPTHALVIPKRHIASLNEATESDAALIGKLMLVAKQIAHEAKLETSGWRAVINSGPDAGQSVFHVHLHVLGGRSMAWPPG